MEDHRDAIVQALPDACLAGSRGVLVAHLVPDGTEAFAQSAEHRQAVFQQASGRRDPMPPDAVQSVGRAAQVQPAVCPEPQVARLPVPEQLQQVLLEQEPRARHQAPLVSRAQV